MKAKLLPSGGTKAGRGWTSDPQVAQSTGSREMHLKALQMNTVSDQQHLMAQHAVVWSSHH